MCWAGMWCGAAQQERAPRAKPGIIAMIYGRAEAVPFKRGEFIKFDKIGFFFGSVVLGRDVAWYGTAVKLSFARA